MVLYRFGLLAVALLMAIGAPMAEAVACIMHSSTPVHEEMAGHGHAPTPQGQDMAHGMPVGACFDSASLLPPHTESFVAAPLPHDQPAALPAYLVMPLAAFDFRPPATRPPPDVLWLTAFDDVIERTARWRI